MKTTAISHILNLLVITVIASVVFLIGNHVSSSSSVAVIDLDKIANATGRTELIANQVQALKLSEEKKLNALKDKLVAEIDKRKNKDSSEPKKTQQIAQLTRNSNLQLQQAANKIRSKIDQLKIQLVHDFRTEIEPIVRQVANNRKFTLVEIMSPGYLFVKPDVDISDEIIDKLLILKAKENNPPDKGS